jgi:DNA-binding response OmpR family regulator
MLAYWVIPAAVGGAMEDSLPGRRVLVVEDNPLLAHDLDDALTERGVKVVGPALDFATGLALVREDSLDGAVLDIDIGGTPVWPIARGLRDDGVPFVFVSADCGKGLPEDLRGSECISKPARTDAILVSVAAAIGKR